MNPTGEAYEREAAAGAPSWRNVVDALGAHFRANGYSVEAGETATMGVAADGCDLTLRRGDELVLVQCTEGGARPLPHNHVHRLLGALVKHGATAAVLVTDGEFTDYARTSAAKLGQIRLVDGAQLQAMLGSACSSPAIDRSLAATAATPTSHARTTPALPAENESRAVADCAGDPISLSSSLELPRNAVSDVRYATAESSTHFPASPKRGNGLLQRFRIRASERREATAPSRTAQPLAGALAVVIALWTMQGAMGSFESHPTATASTVAGAPPAAPTRAPVAVLDANPASVVAITGSSTPLRTVDVVGEAPLATASSDPTTAPLATSTSTVAPAATDGVAAATSSATPPVAAGAVPLPAPTLAPREPAPGTPSIPTTPPPRASTAAATVPSNMAVATIVPRRAVKKPAATGVEDDFRAHERRNAEAMRVLEKTTPAIDYALPVRSNR